MTKEILQKFINNSCSEAETEYIYDWLSDPTNKEEISAIMKISWDNMPADMPEEARSKKYFVQNVLEKNNDHKLLFDRKEAVPEKGPSVQVPTKQKYLWLKIAAAVALLVVALFSIYPYEEQPQEVTQTTFIEKSNPNGRKSTIVLPDGSRVVLNSDSRIRYERGFTENYREVILEGEAFFEVERDHLRPFIVRTGDISTTVLGTSFNVSAYAKSDNIDVAVVTGKVEVKKASYHDGEEEDVVLLTPQKMASYNRGKRKIATSAFNMEEIVGWKDGILIFKNADQAEIASRLKAWYGLDVEFEGSGKIMNKRYTGKFDNNSLEYVLKAISYTSEISFEINGNKVILKQK
ncbi:MAG: FecR domain-containing protein [Cyclobacteriaceae bacterium]